MNHDLTVSASIDIHAGVARVWEVLTNPEIIKEYLFGTETLTDWQPGSSIVFQGEYEGQQYRDQGTIQQNIPHELISYSYWSSFTGLEDKPENHSKVTYRLAARTPELTTLTWTQQGYANEEGYKHSQDGMEAFLEGIKKIAES